MKIITSKLFHEYLNNKKIYIFHDYDINLQNSIKNLTENGWCSAGGGGYGGLASFCQLRTFFILWKRFFGTFWLLKHIFWHVM